MLMISSPGKTNSNWYQLQLFYMTKVQACADFLTELLVNTFAEN